MSNNVVNPCMNGCLSVGVDKHDVVCYVECGGVFDVVCDVVSMVVKVVVR